MEREKRFSSFSQEKGISEKEKKAQSKDSITEERKPKESLKNGLNEIHSKRKIPKPSMIPVVKNEKNESKNILPNQKHSSASSRPSSASLKMDKRNEDFDQKLKLLEEKEKSVAEYYFKIEEMIRNFLLQKEQRENEKRLNRKTFQNSTARKMTSDPLVFSKARVKDDILFDFESNVQQISDIWLKTSNDLSNTLKNLKNNPSLDPMEFEIENVRIQLAIKQAKSLTLVKTRDVIAEAKKLFYDQEIIRTELEKLLSRENLKLKRDKRFEEKFNKSLDEKDSRAVFESAGKQETGGTGDSQKETNAENQESSRETTGTEDSEKGKGTSEKELIKPIIMKDISPEVQNNTSGYTLKEQVESGQFRDTPSKSFTEIETWLNELAKKNKTITNLNSKIFELQKTCNEYSLKYNQMQVKLAEFHEKFQWNQVLWKQIRKLKEQIKGLQQSNKQLESQKKELESKITRLDQELDRLIKINHLLNQKKYLLKSQDFAGVECRKADCKRGEVSSKTENEKCQKALEYKSRADEKIIAEKRNAINQLKTILNAMKDQENFAQKQISVFQSKIEELEKNTKL